MESKTNSITKQFLSARAVSTPLIAIETPDPGATRRRVTDAVADVCKRRKVATSPMFVWDAATGMRPINETALSDWEGLLEPFGGDQMATIPPQNALQVAASVPDSSMVIMSNLHRFWEDARLDPSVLQGIWNLRDLFKVSGRTLVMLMPDCVLPSELRNDVVVLSESMPTTEELRPVVMKIHENAGLPKPSEKVLDSAADALAGLAMQQAEQVTAISLRKSGLDLNALREHQRQQIEQTPGLSIFDSDAAFDQLKGLDALTDFLRRVLNGKRPPKAVVFIDEIEKMLAGAFGQGDSSGTSQEQLGYFLQHMQDENARGILILGPPGTGKSELAKATGNEGDCWTVGLDIGAMKGSLVGESGAMTRRALNVIKALGQGDSFWIATCNSIESLPPELRRRFSYGTWFVELPNAEARRLMWRQYADKFGLDYMSLSEFDDEGWTGAEIRTCVAMAVDMERDTDHTARFISPVSRSSAESLQRLRRLASGRFLDASVGGFYSAPARDLHAPDVSDLAVDLDEGTAGRIIDMDES